MNHFITALKKYAIFSGRASRAEFWYFVLFSQIFSIPFGLIDTVLNFLDITPFFSLMYAVAFFIPSISVSIRRLHDVNKSGWNFLLPLFPIAGAFMYFMLLIKKGDEMENQYGAIPDTDIENTTSDVPFNQQPVSLASEQQPPVPMTNPVSEQAPVAGFSQAPQENPTNTTLPPQ